MDKKTQPTYMLSTGDPPQNKRYTQVESKGIENKILQANGQEKKAGVAILISDKIDFKTKAIKGGKKRHFIILKGIVQQDITLLNICAPNIGAPKYIKKILEDYEKDIDNNTVIIGDFHTPQARIDLPNKESTRTL